MKKSRKFILQIIAGIIMAVIVVYGVFGMIVYSSVGRFPSGHPTPPPHIRSLIWPTIGYPELANAGAPVEAEVSLPGSAITSPRAIWSRSTPTMLTATRWPACARSTLALCTCTPRTRPRTPLG